MDKNLISATPLISVIMPVFNASSYLLESIESILNQTFGNFEFIIIDDSSTDDSVRIIKSFHDDRIFLIQKKINTGLIECLNLAIKIAKGKYIARMDADDICFRERFEKQINFLETNIDYALVGSSALVMNERVVSTENNSYSVVKDLSYSDLFFGNCFVHSSIMIRRLILVEYMYTQEYYLAEDYFLWSQLSYTYKIGNIPEPLMVYRLHLESESNKKFYEQEEYVKKIFQYHLSKLGLNKISDQNFQLHYQILRYQTGSSVYDKKSILILNWIDVLWKKSKGTIFENIYFYNHLNNYWYNYFNINISYIHGTSSIHLIFSPFNRSIKKLDKLKFIKQAIKHTRYFGSIVRIL
jgi:glycosyltransferase involved in cell wall biosynthesis